MRRKITITALIIFALSLISTVFVLLTLTSPRWSVQKYYISSTGAPSLGADWFAPICYANRSPFYRCEYPKINDTATPMTCEIPNCQWYAPYGYNRTSCRLAVETNDTDSNSVTNAGELECQEVHYTGNLQIASSVFIVLSLILLIPLTLANFLSGLGLSSSPDSTESHSNAHTNPTTKTATIEPIASESHPNNHHASQPHPRSGRFSPLTPYLTLSTISLLSVGAALQILAQFFAVFALVQNATPSPFQAVEFNRDILGATPWVMDKALTTYATVAWTSAVAAAGLMGAVYRMPRWEKFV